MWHSSPLISMGHLKHFTWPIVVFADFQKALISDVLVATQRRHVGIPLQFLIQWQVGEACYTGHCSSCNT